MFGKFFDAVICVKIHFGHNSHGILKPIVTHDLASPVFLRKYYGVPTSLVGSASSKYD